MIRLSSYYLNLLEMKIIKKGQTYPVHSVFTNRVFDHIQLLVQSRESKSYSVCHSLIILLRIYKYSDYYKIHLNKSQIEETIGLCQAFLGALITPVFPALYFCTLFTGYRATSVTCCPVILSSVLKTKNQTQNAR